MCQCSGELPPLSPPHWKPKALAPLDYSPRRWGIDKVWRSWNGQMAGRHCVIIWNHQFSSWPQTICWKICVKESNIINAWIPFQPCLTQQKLLKPQTLRYLGEASNVAWGHGRPVQFSWASPRRMLQESPYICSMGYTQNQRDSVWEWYGKISSISEEQQSFRAIVVEFLGNPEVSIRPKKNHGLWRCFGQGLQGSQQHPIWQACVEAAEWQPRQQNAYRIDIEYIWI